MDKLHEQLAEALRVGRDKLGVWLAAAIDDPADFNGMKAEILAWTVGASCTIVAFNAAKANGDSYECPNCRAVGEMAKPYIPPPPEQTP
jgi:hypothetical protein